METQTVHWLTRLRRWFLGKAASPRTAQPHLESLEDRTGLSAVPASLSIFAQDWLPDTYCVDAAPVDPIDQQAVDSDIGKSPEAGQPMDDQTDPGTEFPGTTGFEREPVYPSSSFGGNALGDSRNTLPETKNDQPAGLFHQQQQSESQQPLIQAIARFDGLKQTLRTSLTAPEGITTNTDAYFQIQRTPVTQQPLDVQFEVKAFTRDSVEARQQTARFVAGADKIDVLETPLALRQRRDVEIITLTLQEHKLYQVSRPGATIFVAQHQQNFSETALLRACQEGQSSEALSRLVEMHRSRVHQACYQVLGNFTDAEDASQLVFMMFAQQHFKLQQTVGRWLHAVARNVAISFLRSRQRRRRHEMQAMKSEIASSLGQVELREELDRALDQLPPQLKQAVQLRYLEGWSQNEVAEFLGCPRGTVAQRAARGLQALRKVMAAV